MPASPRKKKTDNRGKRLPVDWESVVSHWLANGKDYHVTAEAFGIKRNTLIKHVSRLSERGEPLTPTAALKQVEKAKFNLAKIAEEDDRIVTTSPVVAMENTLEQNKETFLAGMSSGLSRAASVVSSMDGSEVIENSRRISDLVQAGGKLFGLGNDGNAPGLTLNVLALSADQLRQG